MFNQSYGETDYKTQSPSRISQLAIGEQTKINSLRLLYRDNENVIDGTRCAVKAARTV